MSTITQGSLETLLASIQIPDSAYVKAESRYKDLGEWFNRADAASKKHSPHIYPQGSFRLGTVVRPLTEKGDFDLDVGCRLREGIRQTTHTQRQLKDLVRTELEAYRIARRIEQKLEEKNRCWRLQYQDELSFHMDVVPSIPQTNEKRTLLLEAMASKGLERNLSASVAAPSGAITDTRKPSYDRISLDWHVSNSEGYALWFESRIKQAKLLMEVLARAQVDRLPERQRKSPLQFCVQILKRHRDVMFEKNPDPKPISIIITTLAARAYNGEEDLEAAMTSIVGGMRKFINSTVPRVPNPVNPDEDFADRWYTEEGKRLGLEKHFSEWLATVERDLGQITTLSDSAGIQKAAANSFRVNLNEDASKVIARNNSLLAKAALIATGARTTTFGTIGSVGVANPPHKFFG
ncbi:MAG: nucleotidyltransferase [Opitutaceae bacterium]|nr:nucleotidyltransferase [Opitutaceae bacterium]MBP9900255.1 nucleotidyltransferase [Verrucomicrobiota bacterium]